MPTYVQCQRDRNHLWMNYLLSQLCWGHPQELIIMFWLLGVFKQQVKQCEIFVIPIDICRTFWRTCLTFWLLVWQHAATNKQAGLQGSIALAPWQHGYGFAELSGNLDLVDASWLKCEMRTSKPWRQPKISRPEAPWSLESTGAACVHNHIVDWCGLHLFALRPTR